MGHSFTVQITAIMNEKELGTAMKDSIYGALNYALHHKLKTRSCVLLSLP